MTSGIGGINRGPLPTTLQPTTTKGTGTVAPTTMSAAEAALNQERAFDAVFSTGQPTGAPGVSQEGVLNLIAAGPEAAAALNELRGLSALFMREAPGDAPIAPSFAPDVSVAGELTMAQTSSEFTELAPGTHGGPPPSEDPALDQLHDSYWNHLAQSIPSPDTLASNPAMRYLNSAPGQVVVNSMSPVFGQVVANMAASQNKALASGQPATELGQNQVITGDQEKVLTLGLTKMATGGGIDFINGDIEMLVQVVLMQCSRDNELDLREALADMKARNELKRQKREQLAAMREDKAALEKQLRQEWQDNIASGAIAPTTTYDQYVAFRKVSPGMIDPETGKYKYGSLAQPTPFAGPFPPNMTPTPTTTTTPTDGSTPAAPTGPTAEQTAAAEEAAAAVEAAEAKVAEAQAALDAANSNQQCVEQCRDNELNAKYAEIDASSMTDDEKANAKCQAAQEINEKWEPSITDAKNATADAQAALDAANAELGAAHTANDAAQAALTSGGTSEGDAPAGDTTTEEPPPEFVDSQTGPEGFELQTIGSYDLAKQKLQDEMDSISEIAEQDQLRMQILMDRREKCASMLSNLMKKISDTGSGIIGNMK